MNIMKWEAQKYTRTFNPDLNCLMDHASWFKTSAGMDPTCHYFCYCCRNCHILISILQIFMAGKMDILDRDCSVVSSFYQPEKYHKIVVSIWLFCDKLREMYELRNSCIHTLKATQKFHIFNYSCSNVWICKTLDVVVYIRIWLLRYLLIWVSCCVLCSSTRSGQNHVAPVRFHYVDRTFFVLEYVLYTHTNCYC